MHASFYPLQHSGSGTGLGTWQKRISWNDSVIPMTKVNFFARGALMRRSKIRSRGLFEGSTLTKRIYCIVTFLILWAGVFATHASGGESWLKLESQGGDWVGQGQHLFFTTEDGWFPTYNDGREGVTIHHAAGTPGNYSIGWSLSFGTGNREPLTVGYYPKARSVPGGAYISVSGEGRGCDSTGTFQVKEISFDQNNKLVSFWALFQHACGDSRRGLFGEIRYNADTRVTISAPSKKLGEENVELSFAVAARVTSGSTARLQAVNLPGGAIFQDNGNNTGTFRWTPDVNQIGIRSVSFEASNDTGLKDVTSTVLAIGRLIRVPENFPTIQQAIDAAVDGSRILVGPGTYHENINFKGKWITVKSALGRDLTTIDGGQRDSVVTFDSGEDFDSVIEGFSIANGRSDFNTPGYGDGGGVRVHLSEATIKENRITANYACDGAGVSVTSGSADIQNNIIDANRRTGCFGGIGGGGISVVHGSPVQIANNVISNNRAGANGGGISLFYAKTPIVRNNFIYRNVSEFEAKGGGISLIGETEAYITQNVIVENVASLGGGLYWSTSTAGRSITINNNTIADNESQFGSGVYAAWPAQGVPKLFNNVIRGKPGKPALYCWRPYIESAPPVIKFNNISTPFGQNYSGGCSDSTGILGNVSVDPLFKNPAALDYRLSKGSLSIDAGENASAVVLDYDIVGSPRRLDGSRRGNAVVDMGAFEFIPEARPTMDYDGDSKSDVSVYRNGAWSIVRSSDAQRVVAALGGAPEDIPVPADYDGDGVTDIAIYRAGVWRIIQSRDGAMMTVGWGGLEYFPVVGDYDNDGKFDVAVYANGVWSIKRSTDGSTVILPHGGPGWIPVAADYDGDGKTDVAVYLNGAWSIKRSSDNATVLVGHGGPAWKPVPGDYDGDGKTDVAVYWSGVWSILRSSDNGITVTGHGGVEWVAVPADYDGDGIMDVAVYHPAGVWSIKRSSDGTIQVVGHGGAPQDVPLY